MGIFERIKYIIFPNRCISCGVAVDMEEVLCSHCLELWDKEKNSSCRNCGRKHFQCSCALKADDDGIIPVIYHLVEYKNDSVGKDLIIALKRRENSDICRFLAKEFIDNVCDGEDFSEAEVTFVPRRREVIRQTGSDQAMEIARAVCNISGKELRSVFKRSGKSDQKHLDYENRRKNARSSYQLISGVEDQIAGKSFFLFDDVITSGSTVVACAELLLEKGATKVTAVSVARRT